MQAKLFDQANGLYVPAVSLVDSVTGSPYTLANDFYAAVSFGLVAGITRVGNLGNNPDVDVGSVPEDCWTGGGSYPWMSAATSLEVVSTSALDVAVSGSGARTITIFGLNAAYAVTNQVISLNGLTPVAVPLQLFRINSVMLSSAGSGGINAGDILIRDIGAGTTRAIIPLGYGMSRQSQYTVPASFSVLVKEIFINIQSPAGTANQYADMTTMFRNPLGHYRLPVTIGTTNGAPYNHLINPGIFVAEKTDFSLQTKNVSDNNTNITCAWNGILKAN